MDINGIKDLMKTISNHVLDVGYNDDDTEYIKTINLTSELYLTFNPDRYPIITTDIKKVEENDQEVITWYDWENHDEIPHNKSEDFDAWLKENLELFNGDALFQMEELMLTSI
jgi:hypothetical protein